MSALYLHEALYFDEDLLAGLPCMLYALATFRWGIRIKRCLSYLFSLYFVCFGDIVIVVMFTPQADDLVGALLDKWVEKTDNITHPERKKLSAMATLSLINSNMRWVMLVVFVTGFSPSRVPKDWKTWKLVMIWSWNMENLQKVMEFYYICAVFCTH